MKLDFQVGCFDSPMRFNFKHASAMRSSTQNVMVSVTDGNGNTGYGEGCPRQYVTGESLASVHEFLHQYGPSIRAEVKCLKSLQVWVSTNERLIDNNPSAFCALELALIDLFAKQGQSTIETYLGFPELCEALSYTAVIGDSSPLSMRLISAAYHLYGFSDYKVKLSDDPARDKLRLAALPDDVSLRVDANNLWPTADVCITHLRELGNSFWAIEEPVTAFDYSEMSRISTALNKVIILDESLYTLSHLANIKEYAGRFVANIRVSKCGGLLRSVKLANRCIENGVEVILGAHVGETSLLTRAALAVGQGLIKAPLAREGGYGKILLKRDVCVPDVRFGSKGKLRPEQYAFSKKSGTGLNVSSSLIGWEKMSL